MQTRSDHLGGADAGDGSTFAPTPIWDRSAKRGRRLGASRKPAPVVATPLMTEVADEPRSFVEPEVAPTASRRMTEQAESDLVQRHEAEPEVRSAGEVGGSVRAPVDAEELAPVPAYERRRAAKARGGVSTAAVVAGIAVIGGVAAGAWYMSQPRGEDVASGAAQLAATAPVTAPVAAPAPPAPMMAAAPAAAVPAARPTRIASARQASAARADTTQAAARAASVEGLGVDASATLPEAPIPYAQIQPEAGAAAGATVKPAPVPASSAPAAAPVSLAPAAPAAPVAAQPATTVPTAPPAAPAQQPAPAAPQTTTVNPAPDATTSPTP